MSVPFGISTIADICERRSITHSLPRDVLRGMHDATELFCDAEQLAVHAIEPLVLRRTVAACSVDIGEKVHVIEDHRRDRRGLRERVQLAPHVGQTRVG